MKSDPKTINIACPLTLMNIPCMISSIKKDHFPPMHQSFMLLQKNFKTDDHFLQNLI